MNNIDDDKKWEGRADADDDTLFFICLCFMYSSLDVNKTDSNTDSTTTQSSHRDRSGYQPIRLATELFPALVAVIGAGELSPFWAVLFYFSLVAFGIAQQVPPCFYTLFLIHYRLKTIVFNFF